MSYALRFATASELADALRAIANLEVLSVAQAAAAPSDTWRDSDSMLPAPSEPTPEVRAAPRTLPPPLPAGFEKTPVISAPKAIPAATPPSRTPARRESASAQPANPAPATPHSKASGTGVTNIMLGVIALGLAALAGERLFNKPEPAPVVNSETNKNTATPRIVQPVSVATSVPVASASTVLPSAPVPNAAAAMPNPAVPNLAVAAPIAQAAPTVSVPAPALSPPARARRAAQPKRPKKDSATTASVPEEVAADAKPAAAPKPEAPAESAKPAKASTRREGLFDEKWWQ